MRKKVVIDNPRDCPCRVKGVCVNPTSLVWDCHNTEFPTEFPADCPLETIGVSPWETESE